MHAVILGTFSVCFYAEQETCFLLKKQAALTSHTNVQLLSLWSWAAVTGNVFVTRASFRCILAVYPTPKHTRRRITSLGDCYIIHSHSFSQNTKRISVRSQDTLLLKWIKHQLSVYYEMPIVNGFSKACVKFQFSFWSNTEGRFEKENKRCSNSLTQINTGNYWLQYEVMKSS
jgi:hypothetical protein